MRPKRGRCPSRPAPTGPTMSGRSVPRKSRPADPRRPGDRPAERGIAPPAPARVASGLPGLPGRRRRDAPRIARECPVRDPPSRRGDPGRPPRPVAAVARQPAGPGRGGALQNPQKALTRVPEDLLPVLQVRAGRAGRTSPGRPPRRPFAGFAGSRAGRAVPGRVPGDCPRAGGRIIGSTGSAPRRGVCRRPAPALTRVGGTMRHLTPAHVLHPADTPVSASREVSPPG
jgi:hypothetical protein